MFHNFYYEQVKKIVFPFYFNNISPVCFVYYNIK